jgi:hypothetical protein
LPAAAHARRSGAPRRAARLVPLAGAVTCSGGDSGGDSLLELGGVLLVQVERVALAFLTGIDRAISFAAVDVIDELDDGGAGLPLSGRRRCSAGVVDDRVGDGCGVTEHVDRRDRGAVLAEEVAVVALRSSRPPVSGRVPSPRRRAGRRLGRRPPALGV